MVFARELLSQPVILANPELLDTLERHLTRHLYAACAQKPWSEKVQRALLRRLGSQAVTVQETASALGLSVRSLQMRLQLEGSTFKDLLSTLRIETAKHYLREERLTVAETAFALGYSEVSAFSRFFKECCGVSPRYYKA